ncbi:M23 family metallopeptidase [Sinorhizobium sp. B11]|uniref:M23 family metallopeptidase n=1 Tax=unclassified Rhizobium TaxID=2613769 RepID=UPI000DD7FC57|nr:MULTISPECIES: M23 family metallopeptidase [unclassified Rhizobium]MBB3444584.1 murein DD-endopeptidase MepM/ murein hydrolase activator NlpD [Rhizobium sp. BK379]MBB3563926.1 murein DD-endopeptidase MepM/ murein hydrolase activator NlpD [Rhizobium sp. BK512]
MMTEKMMIRSLGSEPPLLADGRRAPDRREVSLRWLSGTFLTGITSSILMGVALFAALDGRQQLAIPAEAYASASADAHQDTSVTRGGRLIAPVIAAKPSDRAIMEVSTVVHDGEKEVVRRQPFSHVKMMLAANHVATEDYPDFDPLAIFSADEPQPAPQSRTGAIYGSDVESEVALKTVPFPTGKSNLNMAPGLSLDEVEENVRSNGSVLTDGNAQLAALYYVDPRRFSAEDNDVDLTAGLAARVLEQNMTVSAPESITPQTEEFADDILPVRQDTTIAKALADSGYPQPQADGMSGYITPVLGTDTLSKGDVLRIGIIQKGEQAKIIRASIYRNTRHLITVALDDKGRFVAGSEPPMLDAIATAFEDNSFAPPAGQNLPRVYDGIYRAALSYGMTKDMTALIIKLLAANVDFQAQLKPTDYLEAFFSVADSNGQATEDSDLLYVNARFGDTLTRFYRFQDPEDGTIDYFDQEGKSIRQFLLRNPVPNGIFKSGFGMRRHPILGFARMHTGVDWAAPRGTAIIAAGNGTVEKAGWDSGGYGNQTIVRHANGYESSYNHQSAIAKGIVPGAKVRQGQVIGWVGTTGESTGPHLHYELIVNGTKVDPLRIRLPGGKSLQGDALAKFEDERKRIDTLLNNQPASDQVASK